MSASVKVTKAEVWRAGDGWHFRTIGGNNQIIAWGETYSRVEDALAAAVASIPEGTPVERIEADW